MFLEIAYAKWREKLGMWPKILSFFSPNYPVRPDIKESELLRIALLLSHFKNLPPTAPKLNIWLNSDQKSKPPLFLDT